MTTGPMASCGAPTPAATALAASVSKRDLASGPHGCGRVSGTSFSERFFGVSLRTPLSPRRRSQRNIKGKGSPSETDALLLDRVWGLLTINEPKLILRDNGSMRGKQGSGLT